MNFKSPKKLRTTSARIFKSNEYQSLKDACDLDTKTGLLDNQEVRFFIYGFWHTVGIKWSRRQKYQLAPAGLTTFRRTRLSMAADSDCHQYLNNDMASSSMQILV